MKTLFFGKNYPTGSYNYDIYQILFCLKKESNLDKIFENPEFKSVDGDYSLRQIIIDHNYITPISSDIDDFENEISKMSPSKLTNILRKCGIIASGKRKKLIKIALKNIEMVYSENYYYKLTDTGQKFLNDFQ